MTEFKHTLPSHDILSSYAKTVLANGIRVISEELPFVKSVSIGIWIDTGSRNETPDINGVSHFIEHMVFKGTANRSVKKIANSLESVGGYLNAFTGKEHTCYYARVLDEYVENAVDILSDLVQHATFPEKEIEKERLVVLEEIKNVEDDPDDQIQDYFEAMLFPRDPLGLPVLGTSGTVTSFTRSQLIDYRSRFYNGGHIVVAAAGNVTHAKLVELVEQYFSVAAGAPVRTRPKKKFKPHPQRKEYAKSTQQAHVTSGMVAFPVHSPHRYPSMILNTILGDGMSSRLFQNIREKYGFAYSVYSFLTLMEDTGVFGMYAATDVKHIQKTLDLMHKELTILAKKPLTKTELQRSKAQLKGNILLGLESTSHRMMRLGSGELYFNDFVSLESIVKSIDVVTADDVLEVAHLLFAVEDFSTVVFVPEGESTKPEKKLNG
ncbi:MAG TPA: pitrilysin family protein [Bacteroidota bacterium]|nr:pitrilysin family protein [Bacteroidota bacterium]